MNEHWAELLIALYLPVPKHGCGAEHPKVEDNDGYGDHRSKVNAEQLDQVEKK